MVIKNRKHKMVPILKSILFILLLSIMGNITNLKSAATDFKNIAWFLADSVRTDERNNLRIILTGAGLYLLFLKLDGVSVKSKREGIVLYMVSCLFSFSLYLGTSFQHYNNWQLITLNLYTLAVAAGCVLLGSVFVCDILKYIYHFTVTKCADKVCQGETIVKNRKLSKILVLWSRHPFWFPLVLVLVLWLPYLIVLFPGTITYDSMGQLKQAVGIALLNDHHPIAMTYYYKGFLTLGKNLFGSYQAGLFMHNLVQTAVFLSVTAYFSYSLWQKKINVRFNLMAVSFFALFPLIPTTAYCMDKDSLYCIAVMLFVTSMINIYVGEENQKLHFSLFVLSGIIVVLARHNGIYILIPTVCFAFLFWRKKKGRLLAGGMMIAVCAYFLYRIWAADYSGAVQDTAVSSMSIQVQQTARIVKIYDNKIPEEEKEIIDSFLDYDTLANTWVYNPNLSDHVKALAKTSDEEIVKAYKKVWLKQFMRFPMTCIAATVNNTYNYYCCNTTDYRRTMANMCLDALIEGVEGKEYFSFSQVFADAVNKFRKAVICISNFPILISLNSTATYVWLVILLGTFCLVKRVKIKYWIPFVPMVLSIFVCFASPVNGCTRYLLPVIVCGPVLTIYTVYVLGQDNTCKNRSEG